MSQDGEEVGTIPGMYPLGELIESRCAQEGWSTRDVERQAQEAGERINKSRVSEIANEMPKSINRDNLFGLAAGLKVTALTVARAYLASWGIDTSGLETTDSLVTIAIDPSLSGQHKKQLEALIRQMRESGPAHEAQRNWGRGFTGKDAGMRRDEESG